ncbi:uncharacterized protein LOC110314864 [Mus pahari]|uniref:uncharacterized protein LOC110314864 n=1 Tax=Mus pahari TaxID=10093 RepID=UPI000A3046FF|nr:uncharacterized protein LOC110314864 [Mus pahari]
MDPENNLKQLTYLFKRSLKEQNVHTPYKMKCHLCKLQVKTSILVMFFNLTLLLTEGRVLPETQNEPKLSADQKTNVNIVLERIDCKNIRISIDDVGQNLQGFSQLNIEFQGSFNDFLLNGCSSVSETTNTRSIIQTMNIEIFTRMSNS